MFNFLNFIIMKLYGIKMDENERGEKIALIEMTHEEISNLMMMINTACIRDTEQKSNWESEDRRYWMQLYAIKFNDIWDK